MEFGSRIRADPGDFDGVWAAKVEDNGVGIPRERTYAVTGNLFFVTVDGSLAHFDFQEDVDRVVLDLSRSHVWDHSAVAAIDRAVLRFRRRGVEVELVGLNDASATLLSRLAVHDKPGALQVAPGH